jgi:hypothetical protein
MERIAIKISTENRLSFRSVIPFYKQSLPTPQATASTAFSYTSATMNGMFKISLNAPMELLAIRNIHICYRKR